MGLQEDFTVCDLSGTFKKILGLDHGGREHVLGPGC